MPASATFAGTRITSGSGDLVGGDPFATGYTLSEFSSEDPDDFADEVGIVQGYVMYMIAKSRGAWGNNIRVGFLSQSAQAAVLSGGNSD